MFGEVERAYVLVDERGKSVGEGIVEFARKGCALNAVRKCADGCFFITSSLRPAIVESFEPMDDCDGYPEKYLPKKNPEYSKAREVCNFNQALTKITVFVFRLVHVLPM